MIELLVVIAIIVVLASLLLPAIAGIQSRATLVKCDSNLRQIVAAMNLFATDNNNLYPTLFGDPKGGDNQWVAWTFQVQPYLTSKGNAGRENATDILSCPAKAASSASGGSGVATYGLNSFMGTGFGGWAPGGPWAFSRANVPKPSQIILVGDMEPANTDILPTSDRKTFLFGDQGYGMGFRHGKKHVANLEKHDTANVAFCDGHVESLSESQLRLDPPDLASNPVGSQSRWKWW